MPPPHITPPPEFFHRVHETVRTGKTIRALEDVGLSVASCFDIGVDISFDTHHYAPEPAPLFANFRHAVIQRQSVTPQILAGSESCRTDRYRNPAPVHT